jgi:hypothetical protein
MPTVISLPPTEPTAAVRTPHLPGDAGAKPVEPAVTVRAPLCPYVMIKKDRDHHLHPSNQDLSSVYIVITPSDGILVFFHRRGGVSVSATGTRAISGLTRNCVGVNCRVWKSAPGTV